MVVIATVKNTRVSGVDMYAQNHACIRVARQESKRGHPGNKCSASGGLRGPILEVVIKGGLEEPFPNLFSPSRAKPRGIHAT